MPGPLTRRHPPWPHEVMTDNCKHPMTSVVRTETVTRKGVTFIVQYCACVDCGKECETNII